MATLISYRFDTSGQYDRFVEQRVIDDEEENPDQHGFFCCAVCGNKIASQADGISVEGSHCHRKTNPEGRRYRVCCFAAAPGCANSGESTEYFSWFSGYAWSFAYCHKCNAQLGWFFTGNDHFFGLIDEQIKPCDQQGSSAKE
ncbi:MAG: cereblon family protein [Gammaproteobacteria bacterium]|jgi:hypothetical protein